MHTKKTLPLLIVPLSFYTQSLLAEQVHKVDEATGIESWETQNEGVTFSLTQILPDQARAFYVNRGFTLEEIEEFANSCIYMTVIRNDSAPAKIDFRLDEWLIESEGQQSMPIPVAEWLEKLKGMEIKKSALIAFRWAQFPPEQEYEPGGDWNQGMLTTGLPPEAVFNITARWNMNNNQYEGTLNDVRCAK